MADAKETNLDLQEIIGETIETARSMNQVFSDFLNNDIKDTIEREEIQQLKADKSGDLRNNFNLLCHSLRTKGVYVAEVSFFDGIFTKVYKLIIGNETIDFEQK